MQELVDKRDLVDDEGRYVNNDATRDSYDNMIRKIEKKDNALTAEDLAEAIRWVGSLPKHFNINHLEISHINNCPKG